MAADAGARKAGDVGIGQRDRVRERVRELAEQHAQRLLVRGVARELDVEHRVDLARRDPRERALLRRHALQVVDVQAVHAEARLRDMA